MSKRSKNTNFIKPSALGQFGKAPAPRFDKADKKRPWFSYRFICQGQFCIKRCSIEQFKSLSDKLRILSDLEWTAIESSPRETHGFEMIKAASIKGSIPQPFTDEEAIMVFRFGGGKRGGRIAGARQEERFQILFIDRDFSLYDHGS